MKKATFGEKLARWVLAVLCVGALAITAFSPRLAHWQRICGAVASASLLILAVLGMIPVGRGRRWRGIVIWFCSAACLGAFATNIVFSKDRLHDILLALVCAAAASVSFFIRHAREKEETHGRE